MSADQLLAPAYVGVTDVTITVETAITADQAEMFWGLYLVAFRHLRTRAVARQVLHHAEFVAEMQDPRIWKYVAWDDGGNPVGLTTLTEHLETVPWVSPEYFRHRYPDAAARGAIYYLGFTLVHPDRRQTGLFSLMLAAAVKRAVAARAVCAYDVCSYNNESFRFDEVIQLTLHQLADVTFEQIDTQTYYTASFR